MNENVPFIWRKNYRNEATSPEKTLETAHEWAREYLSRAATAARWGNKRGWRLVRGSNQIRIEVKQHDETPQPF